MRFCLVFCVASLLVAAGGLSNRRAPGFSLQDSKGNKYDVSSSGLDDDGFMLVLGFTVPESASGFKLEYPDSNPIVLSATVLPPVLGPVIISVEKSRPISMFNYLEPSAIPVKHWYFYHCSNTAGLRLPPFPL